MAKRKGVVFSVKVRKRERNTEPFSKENIVNGIFKSAKEVGGKNRRISEVLADEVITYLKKKYRNKKVLTTKMIGDAVEKVLIEEGHAATAKAFILYRHKRARMRKVLKVRKEVAAKTNATDLALMVTTPAHEEILPWNKEAICAALVKEANIDKKLAKKIADAVEQKILASGSRQVTTSFIREMVDNELFNLGYRNGKLKRQRALGIPIYDLEELIFSKSSENSNIAANSPEAINLAIAENTLKQYALEKIFSEEVSNAHLKGAMHLHDLGYPTRVYCSSHSLEYIKKYGLDLENLNIRSVPAKHARTLTGHLNTFLASMQAYYAGALGVAFTNVLYAPYLVGMSELEMKQEAQYLLFSCAQNAFSRGGQTLFIDFNIHLSVPSYLKNIEAIGPGGKYTGKKYSEYEKEVQAFAKAMMDVWRAGDAHGHMFEFPKMDLHINQSSFDDPAQFELLKHACLIASENGSPYFVFDRDEVTLSQCCRLKTTLDLSKAEDAYMINHPESLRFCGFQNVTINLPQLAFKAGKGNIDKALEEMDKVLDLAVQAHLQKRSFISKLMNRKGLPLWQVGKPAADGKPYINLDKASYIIGMNGLNECVQFLTGKQLHEDEDVYKLGLKIISHMFLKVKDYEKKHGLKFVLEESPAESATRRFAKIDMREYPESRSVIKGNIEQDQYYYTNSIHLAANAPISMIDRIIKQSKFHSIIEAGAINHAFIGEHKPDPSAILSLVTKSWNNTSAAQITISPEFTICNNCQEMNRGLVNDCPSCGSKDVYGITRIIGYYSRTDNWNLSKIGELRDRHSQKESYSNFGTQAGANPAQPVKQPAESTVESKKEMAPAGV
ncbi:MAG: anaerobic ribonucleoside-triphosphate reductase [bacterium]|nr:anaerobic ribonucleoside-triphosphate reductase [bacterium]MDD5491872.1 anaerobic ribonucleoside-triphosphate reductase [bacterium]